MAFSRLFSSFKAAVPAFARRRPVVTTAMSYLAISYAAPPLIRSFTTTTTNEQNNDDDDPHRPFRAMDLLYPSRMWSHFVSSMIDRMINVRETEDSVVLRAYLFSGVKKEEVEVTVDHKTLTVKDALPGRNQFSGRFGLTGKHCDVVHTTATLKNNVLEIVVPKLKKKEDEDDDIIVHVNVE